MNWLFIAIGALPALGLSWLLHTVDVDRIEMRQRHALEDQEIALTKECQADKKITEDTSATYQASITALNAKLAELLRQPAACIPVSPPKHASGTHAAGKSADLPRAVGLSNGWLYSFAGDADKDRAKVMGLSEFIRRTWKSNGQ